MAYVPHVLIVFGGTLQSRAADDEIWSCSIRAFPGATGGPSTMGGSTDYAAYAGALAAPLKTWFQTATNPVIPTTAKLSYVKVNPIGPNGRYSSTALANTVTFTPVAGAGGGAGVPSFCTLSASWGSDLARGPAARGRIFLPNYAGQASGNALATNTFRANTLASALALVGTIKGVTTGLNGGVMTPALVSNINGTWSYIRTCRVGDVWDTQRRRKNAIAEQYVTGGISA